MALSIIRINPEIKARADEIRCRDWPWLSQPAFFNLLLFQALDACAKLEAPKGVNPLTPTLPGASVFISSIGLEGESVREGDGKIDPTPAKKKKKVRNASHAQLEANPQTPEFARFWTAYQASPHKVATQSKPRAWREWQLALDAGEEPERIINGVALAVEAGFAEFDGYRMPDAARWIKDGRWLALLDSPTSAQAQSTGAIL